MVEVVLDDARGHEIVVGVGAVVGLRLSQSCSVPPRRSSSDRRAPSWRHHAVAGLKGGHALADFLDDACQLVAERRGRSPSM